MKNYFNDLNQIVKKQVQSGEHYTLSFDGEIMDYARFSQGKTRQSGTVTQHFIDLDWLIGDKHASMTLGLSSNLKDDETLLIENIKYLRKSALESASDPYLLLNQENKNSEAIHKNELQPAPEILEQVLTSADGLDLVGSMISGPVYRGFANSFGQINWFEKSSFVVDSSVYHGSDKAIKQSYCDTKFKPEIFSQKMADARLGLELFNTDSVNLKPGAYKVYFSPSAVWEILSMLNWGGFSRKQIEVKNSPLMQIWDGKKSFARSFTLSENIAGGVGPNFQGSGFIKPSNLVLVENGQLANTLVSPKTAKEYHLNQNGADDDEGVCSMDVAPGHLLTKDILTTLGDGLYINNLWYLNFSDRQNACVTGMTRFFCYVVKNGKAQAPFNVMRFDESIFNIFGQNLLGLTKERELIIDNSTYEQRSTASAFLPGALVDKVRLTL